jgi:F-type H+-transporting ATPase subunit b
MDQTLHQLGELLLGAVPTVILLALLYALYTSDRAQAVAARARAERRSKTEGAVEKSRADIAAAEARTAEYEQKLREARAAVFRAQEAKRQAALQARAPTPLPRRAAGRRRRCRPRKRILRRTAPRRRVAGRSGGFGAGNRAARAAAGGSGTMMSLNH